MGLFDFQLVPEQDVKPWEIRDDQERFHWYSMTRGRFWIELGPARLFGATEFYVAQFWELLLDILALGPNEHMFLDLRFLENPPLVEVSRQGENLLLNVDRAVHQIPYDAFTEEVRRFHDRFFSAMESRYSRLIPEDATAFAEEHRRRYSWLRD